MNKRTKALAIQAKVKAAVWQRDCEQCVICGNHNAGPHCHYVRRSQGGLGIEQNIWTGCQTCHTEFDTEGADGPWHHIVADYMKSWYPDWDTEKLKYQKGI